MVVYPLRKYGGKEKNYEFPVYPVRKKTLFSNGVYPMPITAATKSNCGEKQKKWSSTNLYFSHYGIRRIIKEYPVTSVLVGNKRCPLPQSATRQAPDCDCRGQEKCRAETTEPNNGNTPVSPKDSPRQSQSGVLWTCGEACSPRPSDGRGSASIHNGATRAAEQLLGPHWPHEQPDTDRRGYRLSC